MPRSPRPLLLPEPPDPSLRACVIIPARNEQESLPGALRALAEQTCGRGTPLPYELYEVILLINNTTDNSRAVAGQFQRLYPGFRLYIAERNLRTSAAHVGWARRLLMDEAFRRLEHSEAVDAAILSTDADTRVAPNWIFRNLIELQNGADVIGGRVVVSTAEEDLLTQETRTVQKLDHVYRRLVSWTEDRFDPEAHDPWPRHHHHFSASLAIRPHVYRAVGGVPPRRFLEDVAFYDRLRRYDVRIRHSNTVRVFTSARLASRTKFGLGRLLSDWQKSGAAALHAPVETRAFLEYLFSTRRRLRALWQGKDEAAASLIELSYSTGLRRSTLASEAQQARCFGTLLERIGFYAGCRRTWPEWKRLAPLDTVVEEMYDAFKSTQRQQPALYGSLAYASQSASANGHSRSTQVLTGANPLARA